MRGREFAPPPSILTMRLPAGPKSVLMTNLATGHGAVPQAGPGEETAAPAASVPRRARVFVSYKRKVTPDEPVALQVFQALSQHHDVFIDQTLLVGSQWAERIETELHQ